MYGAMASGWHGDVTLETSQRHGQPPQVAGNGTVVRGAVGEQELRQRPSESAVGVAWREGGRAAEVQPRVGYQLRHCQRTLARWMRA